MMRRNFLKSAIVTLGLAIGGLFFGASAPAHAATIGTFGNDFVRDIRIVRLFGERIASGTTTIETGGSDGVIASLVRFRDTSAADIDIDTGPVSAGEVAYGWIRYTGSLTFNNTKATQSSAVILTDMLAQGMITNADPNKVNSVEARVTLSQDGTQLFSAVMGGEGVTQLNSRTGAGSPFGGVTEVFFSPFSTSVVNYSFFAQVVVNGPIPSSVPLPASGMLLLAGIGFLVAGQRAKSRPR